MTSLWFIPYEQIDRFFHGTDWTNCISLRKGYQLIDNNVIFCSGNTWLIIRFCCSTWTNQFNMMDLWINRDFDIKLGKMSSTQDNTIFSTKKAILIFVSPTSIRHCGTIEPHFSMIQYNKVTQRKNKPQIRYWNPIKQTCEVQTMIMCVESFVARPHDIEKDLSSVFVITNFISFYSEWN